MSAFFKVIKEGKIECGHCESTINAHIIIYQVNGEDCGTGTEYESEETATEICDALNWAFDLGKSNVSNGESS